MPIFQKIFRNKSKSVFAAFLILASLGGLGLAYLFILNPSTSSARAASPDDIISPKSCYNRSFGNNTWSVDLDSESIFSCATSKIQPSLLDQPDWQTVGSGDFQNKGQSNDLVWRNKTTGENVIWYYDNNDNFIKDQHILKVPDLNWKIVGVGNFDGQGNKDLLWRNTQTGENVIWYMKAAKLDIATKQISQLTDITKNDYIQYKGSKLTIEDQNWRVGGVGDINGDGVSDIIWRNYQTGENSLWYMEKDTSVLSNPVSLAKDAVLTNEILGLVDVDKDGKVDLVWRDKNNTLNVQILSQTSGNTEVPVVQKLSRLG